VIWGYRYVLGRDPESDRAIAAHQKNYDSVGEFRSSLLNSAEFRGQITLFQTPSLYSGYSREDLAIFDQFAVSPEPTPGFVTDFHGSRVRTSSLWDSVQRLDGTVLPKPVPADYHSETVEWLGVLKAVLASTDRFAAMELGAGLGPWLVAGTAAARLRGIYDIRLLGVEADPDRFALLRQNLYDNAIDPDQHTLICGGVGVLPGKAKWPRAPDPRNFAGSRPIRILHGQEETLDCRDLSYLKGLTDELIDVDIFAFEGLLSYQPVWDLVHIDVQGTEVELCMACLDRLSECVRYLVVGTHSRKLDGDLLDFMFKAGWNLEHEKPTRFNFDSQSSSLERMTAVDGVQVWRNPNL
jgi:hypothetical protein